MTYNSAQHRDCEKYRGKSKSRSQSQRDGKVCKFCSLSNENGTFGKKCNKCGKDNNFKSVCQSDNKSDRDLSHISRRAKERKIFMKSLKA